MNKLLFLAAACISLSGCFVSGVRATPTSSAEKILTLEDKEPVGTLFDKCRALPEVNAACENEKEEAVFKCWQANLEHSNIFIRYSPPSVEGGLIVRQNEHAEPGWGYFVKEDELYINFQLPHLIKIKQGDMSLLPYAEEIKLTSENLKDYQFSGLRRSTEKIPCAGHEGQYVLIEKRKTAENITEGETSVQVFFINGQERRPLKEISRVAYNDHLGDSYVFCDGKNRYFYFTGISADGQGGVLAYNLQTGKVSTIKRNGNWPEVASNPAEIPHTDYFVYTVVRDKEPYSIELYVHRKLKQK